MSYRNEDYHIYSGLDFTEHSGADFSKYSLEDLKKLNTCASAENFCENNIMRKRAPMCVAKVFRANAQPRPRDCLRHTLRRCRRRRTPSIRPIPRCWNTT